MVFFFFVSKKCLKTPCHKHTHNHKHTHKSFIKSNCTINKLTAKKKGYLSESVTIFFSNQSLLMCQVFLRGSPTPNSITCSPPFCQNRPSRAKQTPWNSPSRFCFFLWVFNSVHLKIQFNFLAQNEWLCWSICWYFKVVVCGDTSAKWILHKLEDLPASYGKIGKTSSRFVRNQVARCWSEDSRTHWDQKSH